MPDLRSASPAAQGLAPVHNDATAEIATALKQTPKYRNLCEETLDRVARWAVARHGVRSEATKAAKRKLHQVYGAFFTKIDFKGLDGLVRVLSESSTEDEIRRTCAMILQLHSSTAERIPIIEDLYPAIFRETEWPETVVDLGCGLNPFALPWMAFGREVTYRAYDIDARLISCINEFLVRLGRPPAAECRDLLALHPKVAADLVLLMKTLPSLERQEKGASSRLLREIEADYAIATFPASSQPTTQPTTTINDTKKLSSSAFLILKPL